MMNDTSKRVVTNLGSLILGRVAVGVIGILTLAVLGRGLASTEFGLLMLSITISEIFLILGDFGLSYLGVREIAKGKDVATFFWNALISKVVLVIPLVAAFLGVIYTAYGANTAVVLSLGVATGVLNTFFLLLMTPLNGKQRMGIAAAVTAVQSLITALISIGAIWLGFREAFDIASLRVLGSAIALGGALVVTNRTFRLRREKVLLVDVLALLKQSVPFGLFFTGAVLYFQTDAIQLSLYLGEQTVGFYQAAMKLIITMEMVPLMVSNAMYPAIARLYESSKERTAVVIERITKYLFIIGTSLGLIVFICSHNIITLLFSTGYAPSVVVLQILAVLVPIRYSAHLLGVAITVSDAQSERMMASLGAAFFNIAVNAVVIPLFGIEGAAMIAAGTSILMLVMYAAIIRTIFPIKPWKHIFGRSVLAGACAGIVLLLPHSSSPFISSVSILGVFVSALFAFKSLDRHDLDFIRDRFR